MSSTQAQTDCTPSATDLAQELVIEISLLSVHFNPDQALQPSLRMSKRHAQAVNTTGNYHFDRTQHGLLVRICQAAIYHLVHGTLFEAYNTSEALFAIPGTIEAIEDNARYILT